MEDSMSMRTISEDRRQASIEYLKKVLKPGDTVWTNVSRVAKSGMSRHIHCYIVHEGRILDITPAVSVVCGIRVHDRTCGLVVGGCGMDTCFHVVYCLGRALYRDGYECDGTGRCQSNDHANGQPREKGMKHNDGGYTFRKENL